MISLKTIIFYSLVMVISPKIHSQFQTLAIGNLGLIMNYGEAFPDSLRYSSDHIWVNLSEGFETATIGFTYQGTHSISSVASIKGLRVKQRGILVKGHCICFIKGKGKGKRWSFPFNMPLSGEIISVNKQVIKNPKLITTDPYGAGWVMKIKIWNMSEISSLLSSKQYGLLTRGTQS